MMIHDADPFPRPLSLLFIRHAEAEPASAPTREADDVRPLTERGRKQARVLSIALSTLDIVPRIILTSPLVRARQTAAVLREGGFPEVSIETVDALRMGKCSPDRILKPILAALKSLALTPTHTRLDDASDSGDEPPILAIIGHQPDLGQTIVDLIAPAHPDNTQPMTTDAGRALLMRKGSALLLTWRGDDTPGSPPLIELALQPRQARVISKLAGE